MDYDGVFKCPCFTYGNLDVSIYFLLLFKKLKINMIIASSHLDDLCIYININIFELLHTKLNTSSDKV